MDQAAIDRVLSCRTLPSLPGVALELLEMTRDPGVKMDRIAGLVQNDPALTAKILKTVNSSYYGLSNPCPTIGRAVALLGLNTVKSLVLGFSLVEVSGRGGPKGFDLTTYWRRTIYSAAATRLVARHVRCGDPEEAFIGALLQDVGMLAAQAALGEPYVQLLRRAPEDHQELPPLETAALGFDHPEIGSLLAERWKLARQIVECTRRHHRPDEATGPDANLVRLVALGAEAAAALSMASPASHVSRFASRAAEWFSIERGRSEEMLREIAQGASQLSSLLEIRTGQPADVAAILAQASEQLTEHQIAVQHESIALERSNAELSRQAATDALTGVGNRKAFDLELARCFADTPASGRPLSLLFIDADHFKVINDTYGHQAGDAVLVELADRLKNSLASRGTVFRYGGEEFAALVPDTDARTGHELAEQLRTAVDSRPLDLRQRCPGIAHLRITICVGVATTDAPGISSADQLLRTADAGVYMAKRQGRNCVRAVPASGTIPARGGPNPSSPIRLLLVGADALAAKLIELMFAKRTDVQFWSVTSAADARRAVLPGGTRPDVLVCDTDRPGMQGLELIRAIRTDPGARDLPIVALGAANDESAPSLAAGATLFFTKTQVTLNFPRWVAHVIGAAGRKAV